MLEFYVAPWRGPGRRAPAAIGPQQLIAASAYLRDVEANLAKLADRPALIVCGTRDFASRVGERKRFEATFPNHRTVLFDNASHFLQEDVSDRIAEAFMVFRSEVG